MVDYTNEGFVIPIERNAVKGYASIHAEMYYDFEDEIELPSDGLAPTGVYHIYLLHPRMGSTHFTLEPDNSYYGWARIGGLKWLDPKIYEDDVVQEIIDAIEMRKKKQKLNS